MSETGEKAPHGNLEKSAEQKLSRMLWSQGETKIVSKFLLGNPPNPPSQEKKEKLWAKISETTDFKEEEIIQLLAKAKGFASSVNLEGFMQRSDYKKREKEKISEKEYTHSSIKRAQTILQIASTALRKSGIWGPEESRRMVFQGVFRPDEKSNFSEIELLEQKAAGTKFVQPEGGGPNIRSVIKPPLYKKSRRLGDRRIRKSLAHEIIHNLRALSNKKYWQGHEEKAEKVNLRVPSTPEKKRLIGGFYVGSNKQGSEAVGGLFSAIIDYKMKKGNYPTIEEITPDIAKRFKYSLEKTRERVEKYKKELEEYEQKEIEKKPKPPQSSYFAARYALFSHLLQLSETDCGKIPAINLVAFGSYGYVSFEKMPDLIKLGVTNKEKHKKIKEVVKNIADWLTGESEDGFKLTSQNTQ